MAQVLEQLQLAVCALGQDGCAERLHDLLDGNGRGSELVLCRTVPGMSDKSSKASRANDSPDKTEGTHAHRLQIRVSDIVVSPSYSQWTPQGTVLAHTCS